MIDTDLEKRLRTQQAKIINKTQKSYSFSQAINDTIRKGLH